MGKGTSMVKLSSPDGVEYCIDKAEVTQGQYQDFLIAKGSDVTGQDPYCQKENGTYEPKVQKVPDDPGCPAFRWDPVGKPNYPVECVDLCDARAYCKWAGKRLCGRIGGGLQPSDPKQLNDASKSQWYNACSQGGKLPYAYGPVYDGTLCSDHGPVDASPGCHAEDPPYSEILDLSGNLSEWEDVDLAASPAGATAVARAPKAFNPDQAFRCDVVASGGFGYGVSFRCCADL